MPEYMREEIEVDVHRAVWSQDALELLLWHHGTGTARDRTLAVGVKVDFEEVTPENQGHKLESTFKLSNDRAQQLVDRLWECGIRPSQAKGSSGQLESVDRHLQDMRKLVAKELGVEL